MNNKLIHAFVTNYSFLTILIFLPYFIIRFFNFCGISFLAIYRFFILTFLNWQLFKLVNFNKVKPLYPEVPKPNCYPHAKRNVLDGRFCAEQDIFAYPSIFFERL